eukprot:Pompholyxophrys_punicea_v1_NODE_81_length_3705_cov_14.177534.p3 type:complete len:116 gc:universal NODE_81_length_3705_cov_14.177534:502-155(-)
MTKSLKNFICGAKLNTRTPHTHTHTHLHIELPAHISNVPTNRLILNLYRIIQDSLRLKFPHEHASPKRTNFKPRRIESRRSRSSQTIFCDSKRSKRAAWIQIDPNRDNFVRFRSI